jgi:hypothetical protein
MGIPDGSSGIESFTMHLTPFGHRWGLAQHLRDVSLDEMATAAAEAFGGGSST